MTKTMQSHWNSIIVIQAVLCNSYAWLYILCVLFLSVSFQVINNKWVDEGAFTHFNNFLCELDLIFKHVG